MMQDLLIIVDKNDKVIGLADKEKCHQSPGILHRAFSIFIFDKNGQLLLQKRSRQKPLWPLFWSNSCCSHPRKGENITLAAQNRLKQELGIDCQLKSWGKLSYQAGYLDRGAEREMTYILTGIYQGPIFPNKEEVAEIKWENIQKLKEDLAKNPTLYTPWFNLIFKKMFP